MSDSQIKGKNGNGAPKRLRRQTAVAALLPKLLAPGLRKRGFVQASILTEWPAIVGTPFDRFSCPIKITFPPGKRTGGTLHLKVVGSFAHELQAWQAQIIERINSHFGYGAVARLHLVHGPSPCREQRRHRKPAPLSAEDRKRLDDMLDDIPDDDVRSALDRLGRAVLAKGKEKA